MLRIYHQVRADVLNCLSIVSLICPTLLFLIVRYSCIPQLGPWVDDGVPREQPASYAKEMREKRKSD